MNKIIKIVFTLIVVITILCQYNTLVFATGDDSTTTITSIDEIDTTEFNPADPGLELNMSDENFGKMIQGIVTIIRNIGMAISVIALMIIGIKELTASAQDKSIIKKSLPGYIVGVCLIIAITWLPTLIFEIAKTFNN